MSYGRGRYSNYSNMPSMLFEEYVPFELQPVEDSYEEVEIQMPIPRDRNQIPAIHALEVLLPAPDNITADGDDLGWQLVKRSKTALSDLSDSDVLFRDHRIMQVIATANGTAVWITETFRRYDLKYPIASPHVKLFFGVSCDAGGAPGVVTGRICYTMRYVSRADIMEALMD